MEPDSWDVEKREDGTVLVRVHSYDNDGCLLPDAIFAFRAGDPQFSHWEKKLQNRNATPG